MKHHDDVTLFFLVILLRSPLYRVESLVFDIALHIMNKMAIIRYTQMRIKSFLTNIASRDTYFPLAKTRHLSSDLALGFFYSSLTYSL